VSHDEIEHVEGDDGINKSFSFETEHNGRQGTTENALFA
jgi:hypothetical protein